MKSPKVGLALRPPWIRYKIQVFIHKAKVMYKLANNTASIYLTDLFQMRGSESNLNHSQLNLRSTSNNFFLLAKPKISLFQNSLSYSGALVWNSVPLWIKKLFKQSSHLLITAYNG